jgi:hypothetical protein
MADADQKKVPISDAEIRAKQAAAMKIKWADPLYRQKVAEGRKNNAIIMAKLKAQKEAEG